MSFSFGIVSMANYIVDNALYPVLFMSYLSDLFEQNEFLQNSFHFYSIQIGIMFFILFINMIGNSKKKAHSFSNI